MRKHKLEGHGLLWFFFLTSAALIRTDAQDSHRTIVKRQVDENKRVVCYFANWAVYRQGTGKFSPQNINPYLCTHLIYAFGGLGKDDTIQPFDKYQDIEKGGYGQFAALKTYNRDLKTLIAIGGWNEGSRRFSPLVADPNRRKTFIRSAVRFLRQYNFDGLDLDWEYPSARDGGKPEDRKNYAIFVRELREAFESEAEKTGKARLLLTMAVPASLEYAGKGFDIESLDQSLDFFNLLTYDYHSSYEPATNHHSPLFRPADVSEYDFRADLNIDSTVKFYIEQGASRNKLVLGIPTYGRSYTLVNADAHAVGSPTDGPGEKGKFTKEDGYLAYYEVCEGIKNEAWEIVTSNPGEIGPYAHKDKLWVGYDDEDIVREKAHYVSEEGMGGIMFWTIDNDDFRGACGNRPFPLIESAKEALYGKEGTIKTATSVSVSTSEQTRIERLKLSQNEIAQLARQPNSSSNVGSLPTIPKSNRVEDVTTTFGIYDPFSTPAPPTTPSNEPGYQCKDEGFFPHTSSCKKYYWCLEVPGTGMVAHTFTCPQGLYFNSLTDGCDFRRNVDCDGKSDDETEDNSQAPSTTSTQSPEESAPKSGKKKEQTLEEVLAAIKEAGGIDEFEEKIRLEEEAKKEQVRQEEERRQEITQKTRSRLTKLLDKKRAEVQHELARNSVEETGTTKIEIIGQTDGDEGESATLRPNRFKPQAGVRDRLRIALHEKLEDIELDGDQNAHEISNESEDTPSFVAEQKQRIPSTEKPKSDPAERYYSSRKHKLTFYT